MLFSTKIFIVPAFIMNWTFIFIKLLIYWSSAASFTYQTSESVAKRTGRLVPVKTATCKYLYFLESFTLRGRQKKHAVKVRFSMLKELNTEFYALQFTIHLLF